MSRCLNNNNELHTNFREFFDRPLAYDRKGCSHVHLPKPMAVYENRDGSPMTSRIIINKSKIKELARRAHNSKSELSQVDYRKKFANQKVHHVNEYGTTSNQMFATFLRLSEKFNSDRKVKKREKSWNQRFATPFSDYNELVFKKYRKMFDDF